MAKRTEKVRFLALLLCVAMLFSVFPGKGASARSGGKNEGASNESRVITYDMEEKMLSGDIAIAASGSVVQASACTLVITKEEPGFAIGATSAAIGVSGIRIEGEDITVAAEDAGYRISFAKKGEECPEASQVNILYWYKNDAGEYIYTGIYPAVVEVVNGGSQGKISSDKKYVGAGGKVSLWAESGYKSRKEDINYEWFAVSKEGQEEELGVTGQEYVAQDIKKGINRFRCKVTVEGGTYQDSFDIEIVGYEKEVSLQVGQSASINRLIFGEKEGIGTSPVSVQMKGSYNKKKFQKKKYKKAYNKCLEWGKESPDKIRLKSYCECGKLEITMPGQQEGEKETFSVRLDGSLVFPDCKLTVKMAKDRKSLTAVFKNVKGGDKIQFAVGQKGKSGKNNRKWTINKKKAKNTHRIGYSQKNGKRIKEKVFFGRIGKKTVFGVKYSDWVKCKVKAKKARK